MKKMITKVNETKNTMRKVYHHFKKNITNYIILCVIGYIVYQIVKIVKDDGMGEDGTPYYDAFTAPDENGGETNE